MAFLIGIFSLEKCHGSKFIMSMSIVQVWILLVLSLKRTLAGRSRFGTLAMGDADQRLFL